MKALLIILLSSAQFALAANKAPKTASKAAAAPAVPTLKCDPAQGKVSFAATAKPGFLNFTGEADGPQGELQVQPAVKGKFTFNLDKLTTKLSLRDTHMKEKYLETKQFPTAELQVDEVTGFDTSKTEPQSLPFKGQLTVRGVQKPVAGTVTVAKLEKGYDVKANFDTKISNFGIKDPSHMGVTVQDDIKVSVETKLN